MTPREEAEKRLAEAQARLRAAQQGNAGTTAGTPDDLGSRRGSILETDVQDVDAFEVEEDSFGQYFEAVAAGWNPVLNGIDMFNRNKDNKVSRLDSFRLGAADTITFGFLDEIEAGSRWAVLGEDYVQALRTSRARAEFASENFEGTYLAGQLAGGLVPVAGVAGRAHAGIRAAVTGRQALVGNAIREGAIYGGIYGFGSSDSEDIFSTDRLQNAAVNAAFGAAGGFILGTALFHGTRLASQGFSRVMQIRQGKPIKLNFQFKSIGARQLTDAADLEDLASLRQRNPGPSATPREPDATKQVVNRITGKPSDALEDGAIASANDIIEPAKREVLLERIARLDPQQAKAAARSLNKAMESGDLTKDPHFRSILGLDLEEFGDLEKVVPEVADMLTEMSEEILAKGGYGRATVKGMEAELRRKYGSRISEETLDDLLEKTRETRNSATVGKVQMTLAGVQFARVSQDLLPEVMKGNREARELLAEELSKSLRIAAKGQALMSEAGRNLGMLKNSKSLLFRELDDGTQLASIEEINERVRKSLDRIDDEGLNELLMSARDLSNLEEVSEILMDPIRAESVSMWMRFRNTSEAFMKSTVLTPATAAVNFVGVPIHSWMRHNGARRFAEAAFRASGDEKNAMIVAMQRQASQAVRWHAHKEGAMAAFRRIKWEALGSFRSIASVAGASRLALRAGVSRQAMIARGYKPPPVREFDLKKRLAVTDLRGFEQKLKQRAESDMPFASFVNALERTGAVAVNTVDALGTAAAKLASGTLDDYGRAVVMTREVYAEMAGKATREALENGVKPDDIANYVQKRTQDWSTIPPREVLERVENRLLSGEDLDDVERMLVRRDFEAEREAERVLFLDGPQTTPGRVGAAAANIADTVAGAGLVKGALMPYISTPTRIMERGLASYTPWGHLTDEVARALNSADPVVRAMERARMDLGGTIISVGMVAAATGAITVTNGSYRNTEGLGQVPAMRVNLPNGSYAEFGRLDPIALSLSMGAIIGQMWKSAQDAGERYGQDDAISEAFAVAYSGMRDALLEKSYLTGLNELVEAMTSQEEGAIARYYEKYIPDTAGRFVPFSGTIRQVNETATGKSLEAVGWLDRIAKVTPGMGAYLPARVDALGNEVDGRVMGFAIGTTSDDDAVTAKMRELGVDISNLRKADPSGFDLTSEELSDLRKIRANEALNSDGLTMKEALADLFADPAFQSLPDKSQVQDEIVAVMRNFNQPAREIYEARNQSYLADREAARSFKAYIEEGLDANAARRAAQSETQAAGLEPTRTDALR